MVQKEDIGVHARTSPSSRCRVATATSPVAEAVSALSSSVGHGRNGKNALLSCRLFFRRFDG